MGASQPSYPALRVIAGPEKERRIPLVGRDGAQAVEFGSQVDGPGRLTASGVAPRHAEVGCQELEDRLQTYVVPLDGEVVVNGAPEPYGEELEPGAEIALGGCTMVMEIVGGLPPAVQAELTAKEQATAGDRPYRWFVQFKPDGGEKAVGVLSAGKGRVSLADRDGRTLFQLPLEGLEVSFPRHRSRAIIITAQGMRYNLRLLEPAWIPAAEASAGDTASEAETDPLPLAVQEHPDLGSLAVTDPDLAVHLGGAISVGWSLLEEVGGRMERHTWKQILEGDRHPEEVSEEYARMDAGE
jgi:hypothetical protein